jgi:protein PhnA
MTNNSTLQARSNSSCELCSESVQEIIAYAVPPKNNDSIENEVALCENCALQINSNNLSDTNHWRCLTGSIWSEVPSVQALSYKLLTKLNTEDWATEALESVQLDEAIINWANAEADMEASKLIHKDAFGVVLQSGDTIILTQNLNIKGASLTASKGTVVRKIKLVPDNDEQIEGKIEGDVIVILTKFVRKSTV